MSQSLIKQVSIFSTANPKHAIASLRLIAPLSAAGIEINWMMPDHDYDDSLISGSDLVVIQRDFPRFADRYMRVHMDAHRFNIPVIYEIDDLLWELPEGHPDKETHYYTDALLPMLVAAWTADGITVPSNGIKEYLSWLNPNIFVLPNYLNLKLWAMRNPELSQSETVSIGYIGGDSHLPDLQMISSAILDILNSYQGRVKFTSWGLKPPDELRDHPLVEWHALTPGNYAAFAEYCNQQHFDIYIAPLKNSLFNRCKSSIKILEYTSLGITGVSSDLDPYSEVINQGVTGLLADTIEHWEQHLKTLIDQPDVRLQVAKQAQISLSNNWLLSDHFDQWMHAYHSIKNSFSLKQDLPLILQLMNSIVSQNATQKEQLQMELEDQRSELLQLKNSRSWQATQIMRSIYNRLFSPKRRRSVPEIQDES